jgi:hypothetical protein
LVICGWGVQRIKVDSLNPSSIILVSLTPPDNTDLLYDTYLRNRINEKYTEHFLIEFVRGLLDLGGPRLDQERIDEARMLAEHVSACRVSSLLLKKDQLSNYV